MSKFNALNLIGKKFFEGDVVDKSGIILFPCGDEITEAKLLQLYFREVSYREPQKPVLPSIQNYSFEMEGYDGFVDRIIRVQQSSSKDDDNNLEFDRNEAEIMSKTCEKVAEILGMEDERLENAKNAGYFFKIGNVKLPKDVLHSSDYDVELAHESSTMLTEMQMTNEVIISVQDLDKSCTNDFPLTDMSDFPLSHIVAICHYWSKLRKKYSDKDECLKVLRQQGGKRFNIFVLHRFINYLRVNYE